MNINQYTGFIRWVFKSFGQVIARANRDFRKLMDNEFWLSVLLWVLFTALSLLPVVFTAIYFSEPGSAAVPMALRVWIGLAVAYFVGTGVNLMYENYRQEQEELIRELARRG